MLALFDGEAEEHRSRKSRDSRRPRTRHTEYNEADHAEDHKMQAHMQAAFGMQSPLP